VVPQVRAGHFGKEIPLRDALENRRRISRWRKHGVEHLVQARDELAISTLEAPDVQTTVDATLRGGRRERTHFLHEVSYLAGHAPDRHRELVLGRANMNRHLEIAAAHCIHRSGDGTEITDHPAERLSEPPDFVPTIEIDPVLQCTECDRLCRFGQRAEGRRSRARDHDRQDRDREHHRQREHHHADERTIRVRLAVLRHRNERSRRRVLEVLQNGQLRRGGFEPNDLVARNRTTCGPIRESHVRDLARAAEDWTPFILLERVDERRDRQRSK
jgi:hypothetical protein